MEHQIPPPTSPSHSGGTGYTNGISAHTTHNWIIRGNLFKNFHTPDTAANLWNPAILMWNHSQNTTTENNVFINVDRSIAYGLIDQTPGTDHSGGVIRNNFVYYSPALYTASRTAASDGSIIANHAPHTLVYHNTILTNGNLNFAIEFRFPQTSGEIRNNLVDANINLRDSAPPTQSGNLLTPTSNISVNPTSDALPLLSLSTSP